MPFHLPTVKYSSLEYQKIHEYEYKKFLKNLQHNNSINISKEKFTNNLYLFQREINLQYRENKRKIEYERIQKENSKFSQKLINAKTFFNQYEQQRFFNKHCKLKQRLQRYPNLNQIQIKKSKDSTVFIYNDNEKFNINKYPINQKKFQDFTKHNSHFLKTLPPITSTIQSIDSSKTPSDISNTKKDSSKIKSSFNSTNDIVNWNISTNIKDSLSPLKIQSMENIVSSQSSLTISNLFI